jgi:hypothetical protein
MIKELISLFEDNSLIPKIKRKLPYMFSLAELELSKSGRVGMEVGTIREQIIIALLIYKFGYENIRLSAITSSEVDIFLFNKPISIKTIKKKLTTQKSNKLSGSGIKLIWTVDWEKVKNFCNIYEPKSELLLVEVVWEQTGGFYYIPLEVQKEIFELLGKEEYLFKHREGTNPRGVELSNKAIKMMLEKDQTKKLEIYWKKENQSEELLYQPYKRWVELWEKD